MKLGHLFIILFFAGILAPPLYAEWGHSQGFGNGGQSYGSSDGFGGSSRGAGGGGAKGPERGNQILEESLGKMEESRGQIAEESGKFSQETGKLMQDFSKKIETLGVFDNSGEKESQKFLTEMNKRVGEIDNKFESEGLNDHIQDMTEIIQSATNSIVEMQEAKIQAIAQAPTPIKKETLTPQEAISRAEGQLTYAPTFSNRDIMGAAIPDYSNPYRPGGSELTNPGGHYGAFDTGRGMTQSPKTRIPTSIEANAYNLPNFSR